MSKVNYTDTLDTTLLGHRGKLLGFIRSKVSDPHVAEDILHDSLMKAMGALSQLEDEEKLVSWFYQLVRNAIIDRQRSKQTENKYLRVGEPCLGDGKCAWVLVILGVCPGGWGIN